MQRETIVTMLSNTTHIADNVASNATGCVEPSDNSAIMAIESKAMIRCAWASSIRIASIFLLLNLFDKLNIIIPFIS